MRGCFPCISRSYGLSLPWSPCLHPGASPLPFGVSGPRADISNITETTLITEPQAVEFRQRINAPKAPALKTNVSTLAEIQKQGFGLDGHSDDVRAFIIQLEYSIDLLSAVRPGGTSSEASGEADIRTVTCYVAERGGFEFGLLGM